MERIIYFKSKKLSPGNPFFIFHYRLIVKRYTFRQFSGVLLAYPKQIQTIPANFGPVFRESGRSKTSIISSGNPGPPENHPESPAK
jgi:hypothetical protein